MNKKLIAVAVATAFAAPMAASADATIYGNIYTNVGVQEVKTAGTKTTDQAFVNTGDGTLGIKGSEDLGNGLKAIYKYELGFNTDVRGAGTAPTTDEVWVGLAGDWGAVALGAEDHPYKNVLNASGYNPFGDTIVDLDSSSGGVLGGVAFRQNSANNAVLYISPNFNGFSGQIAAVAPEGGLGTGVKNSFDAFSMGVNYAGGGLKVGLAYEDIDIFTNGTGSESWVLAGSYKIADFGIGAAYESTENARNDSNVGAIVANDVDSLGLSLTYDIGNSQIGAMYVDEEQEGVGGGASTTNTDIQSWGLIAKHNLSNRTMVYASYATGTAETAGVADDEVDTFAVGLHHDF